MPENTLPGAVDLPGLTAEETAYRWDPSDLYATGWLMGLLSSTGTEWLLTGGLGDAAWLSLGDRADAPTARRGDFVVIGPGTVRVVHAVDVEAIGA